MTVSILEDAFGHHVWATLRVIDTCSQLAPQQLETTMPGTYGSIIDTLRHLVGADSSYLSSLTRGARPRIDEDTMGLSDLRAEMKINGPAWSAFLERDPDPESVVAIRWDDGSETIAPVGIRLAQALHHGTDHRSQICTSLTTLGIEPPAIDAWGFGEVDGRVTETTPSAEG